MIRMLNRLPRSTRRMNRIPVLIVGAGPTGLVLALWLTRRALRFASSTRRRRRGRRHAPSACRRARSSCTGRWASREEVVEEGIEVRAATSGWRESRRAPESLGQRQGTQPLHRPADVSAGRARAHAHRAAATRSVLPSSDAPSSCASTRMDDRARHDQARRRQPRRSARRSFIAGCDGAHSVVREGLRIGFPGGTYDRALLRRRRRRDRPVANHEVHVDFSSADFLAVFPDARRRSRATDRRRVAKTDAEHAASHLRRRE